MVRDSLITHSVVREFMAEYLANFKVRPCARQIIREQSEGDLLPGVLIQAEKSGLWPWFTRLRVSMLGLTSEVENGSEIKYANETLLRLTCVMGCSSVRTPTANLAYNSVSKRNIFNILSRLGAFDPPRAPTHLCLSITSLTARSSLNLINMAFLFSSHGTLGGNGLISRNLHRSRSAFSAALVVFLTGAWRCVA